MDASRGMTRRSMHSAMGALVRRWYWPAIFCIVFAFAAAALYLWRGYYPKYKVSRTFIPAYYYVDNNGNAIVSDSIGGIIVRSMTYSQLVQNNQVRDAVRNALDFDITKEEYDQAILAEVNDNSAAVTLTVEWRDRAQALQISQAVKAYLTHVIAENADAGTLIWLEGYSAESEIKPTPPSLFFALGALLGLVTGACFAMFLGVADKRVFDIEQVRYGSDVDVIGVIGKDRVFTGKSWANRSELNNSHRQLAAIALHIKTQMGTLGKKLVMCTAPTGNCGTTRVATEVAKLLSNMKLKVLIVTVKMKASPDAEPPAAEPATEQLYPGVDGCVCTWDDSENNSAYIGPISKTLSEAMNRYDFILVDCPPLLENVELALFTGGMDATLLVLRYGKTKYGEVLSAVSLLKRAQASPVWAVWNYADRRYLESPCIRSSNQCLLLEANDDRP